MIPQKQVRCLAPSRLVSFALMLAVAACLVSCGSGGSSNTGSDPSTSASPAASGAVPHIGHVALMVFENQQEDKILGNVHMPYLTQLAQQNAYAAQYYANAHPSLGNYFMLTTGQVISNDINFNATVDADNIVRELIKAGKTWKAYEESIPSIGYLGDQSYPYDKAHDPAAYFSDVRNDPAEAGNLVGLNQLQADLASGNVPNFMFIEPNRLDAMHDCPGGASTCDNDARVSAGDAWAAKVIPTIIDNPVFKNDGLLIITWDESWDSDSVHGGGHVLTILIGPSVKKQFVSNSLYQHQSVLRTICDAVGVPCMGAATNAPAMAEFFTNNLTP